jgi:hypothetical protein
VKRLHLLLYTKMYALHNLDMNGAFPNFMLYSARILEKYKSLKVSYSINALKFETVF